MILPLRAAPNELVRGEEAVAEFAARIALHLSGVREGSDLPPPETPLPARVLLVHGRVGYPTVRDRVEAAFAAAGIEIRTVLHHGPCSHAAMDAVAAERAAVAAPWIVGVGGGKVLDVAKGAARKAGVPYAALPTSPATCAAAAPTVVVYDGDGRHLDAWEVGASPVVTALDPAVLAAAPDRLLASGIVDAWAKIHEVRLTCGDAAERAATARAALALIEDLAALLTDRAQDALDAGPDGTRDPAKLPARRLVAEAVITHPGLIGGLAGRDAKLAVAHPVHDALTALPDAKRSLHGELVGFGNLVQIVLAQGGEPAARAEAERYARLGLACHLGALGAAEARDPEGRRAAARRALSNPAVLTAIPDLSEEALAAAIEVADRIGRAAAPTEERVVGAET